MSGEQSLYTTLLPAEEVLTAKLLTDISAELHGKTSIDTLPPSLTLERLLAIIERLKFQPIGGAPRNGEMIVCIAGSSIWFDCWMENIPENWINHKAGMKATHFYRLPLSGPPRLG